MPRSPLPPSAPPRPEPVRGLPRAPGDHRLALPSLRRITSSGALVPEIDGLRFVAILAVVAFHAYECVARAPVAWRAPPEHAFPAAAARHGHCGVDLFFVISGLVLGLPFARRHLAGGPPVRLGPYLLRRLTRLEPPYVLCLLLLFGLRVVVNHQPAGELLPHLLASLAYAHGFVYGQASWINLVAWSLEVEVQFYLLAPLLAAVFLVRRPALRRVILVGAAYAAIALQVALLGNMARPAFDPSPARAALSLLNYLQFFLAGFLLADLSVTRWARAPGRSRRWDLVSLAGWPLVPLFWELRPLTPWLFPPLVFVLYTAALRGDHVRRLLAWAPVATLGGMCYTIYLLHLPLNSALGGLVGRLVPVSSFSLAYALALALLLPPLLAVSVLYFVCIERPCMRRDWPARLLAFARAAASSMRRAGAGMGAGAQKS